MELQLPTYSTSHLRATEVFPLSQMSGLAFSGKNKVNSEAMILGGRRFKGIEQGCPISRSNTGCRQLLKLFCFDVAFAGHHF